MAESETLLRFGVKGAEKTQQQVQQINTAYAGLNREIAKTGRLIRTLYTSNDEKGKQQVDHLRDAYKRLQQQASSAKKDVDALNGAVGRSPSDNKAGSSPVERVSGGSSGWNRARSVAGLGFGMLGVGGITGALLSGFNSAKQYTVALSDLSKQLHQTIGEHATLSKTIEDTANALGISYNEMTRYAKVYSNLTGTASGAEIPAKFARGMGMDLGSTTHVFGQMGQYGAVGADKTQMTSFAGLIAEAVTSGKMQGREEELLHSLASLVGNQTRVLTSISNANMRNTLGTLTMMNANGPAGLRGQMGAQYLQTLNTGLMRPGGGETGTYLMSQALGQNDWFKLQWQMEEGLNNLPQVMPYLHNLIKDPLQRSVFMKQFFPGTTAHQNFAFEQAYNSVGPARMGDLDKFLKGQNVSGGLMGIDAEKLKVISQLYQLSRGDKSVGSLEGILNSPELQNISPEQKAKLVKENDISGALKAVVETSLGTDGDKTRQELQKIQNSLTSMGTQIVKSVTDIASGVNVIVSYIMGKIQGIDISGQTITGLPPVNSNVEAREPGRLRTYNQAVAGDVAYTSGVYKGTADINQMYDNGRWGRASRKMEGFFTGTKIPDSKEINARIEQYRPMFESIAKQEGVDSKDLMALGLAESTFNPEAKSPTGARGMMQFTRKTGAQYGLYTPKDFYDPEKNVRAGARYYRKLLYMFKGNKRLAWMAYNAGEGAVLKYLKTGDVSVFNTENLPNKSNEVMQHAGRTEAWLNRLGGSADTNAEYQQSVKKEGQIVGQAGGQTVIDNNITVTLNDQKIAEVRKSQNTNSGQNSAFSTDTGSVNIGAVH